MNKSTNNMYAFVTNTYNPVKSPKYTSNQTHHASSRQKTFNDFSILVLVI